MLNNAYTFDGVDDKICLPFTSASLGSEMTIAAWVYRTKSNGTNVNQGIVSNDVNITDRGVIFGIIGGSGNDAVNASFRNDSGTAYTVTGSTTLPVSTWKLYALTYDGVTLKLFEDAVLVDSNPATGTIAGTTNFEIGHDPFDGASGRYFGGNLDDIRIYDRALSASEIAALYALGQTPTITSFTPTSGAVGTSVTITGTNFDTTPANNNVKFNGTVATITGTPTATSIVTTVPAGATTGPITVEVGGQTATSATSFTVNGASPSEPTLQASNLIITQPFASTINVTWTNGDGASRLVVARQGGVVDQSPVDGTTYIASSSFSSGNDLSGGNYVVYNGTGNSVSVTDIQPSVSYEFFVFEYNGNAGSENYNISTATNNPKGNSSTTSVPDLPIPYSSFGSAESNYRIIAVPLSLTNNKVSDVFDELIPYDDTRWRMFHYQSGANQELNANSTIGPGQGYWLIVKDSKTFSSGPGETVQAPFSVSLVQGWNQIGNPYNFNISWADVQAANPGLPGLRKWIGTMTDGTTLDKMEGGFVNATAAGTLVIPPIDNGGRTREDQSPFRNALNESNWQVYLNVDQGELMNRIAGIGMNAMANDDYDIYDGLSMPHFFDSYLEVNHKKALNGNFFSKDIITTAQNHIWEFSINTSGPEEVMTFSWDNSYLGDNDRELYLRDVTLQRSINMRTSREYAFDKNVSHSFQVLFGSADFVKEKSSVQALILHKAWPNPADNEVNIAFSLPETGQDQLVRMELVDLMGRKAWSHENVFESGFHEVKWERSKQESAGIYLVTIKTAGAFKQVKVVLK